MLLLLCVICNLYMYRSIKIVVTLWKNVKLSNDFVFTFLYLSSNFVRIAHFNEININLFHAYLKVNITLRIVMSR